MVRLVIWGEWFRCVRRRRLKTIRRKGSKNGRSRVQWGSYGQYCKRIRGKKDRRRWEKANREGGVRGRNERGPYYDSWVGSWVRKGSSAFVLRPFWGCFGGPGAKINRRRYDGERGSERDGGKNRVHISA